MPPKVKKQTVEKPTARNVVDWFRQWVEVRSQKDLLLRREDELKRRLTGAIQTEGYADDKGHLYLELDEEVAGIGTLKYQKAESKSINSDRAMALIRAKKLEERCIVLVPTLDQEEIYKAHYDGLISQDELDSLIDKSVSYSFRQVRA